MTTAERVAILYLMYAMYFKQPANSFCKFRCTHGDWTKMKQFYDSISVDAEYLQARTIFWRLWQHNAFRFVDCDREHYPETMQFHRLENDGLDNFQKINATIVGRLNELQSRRKGLLSAIGTLQMGYNEMKEHFASTQGQCTELQSIDVIADIDTHLTNVRKLFESKFESVTKKGRKEHMKSVKRMLLAGPSKSAAATVVMGGEQDSDLDSDLNESNDESTSYSEYEDCGDGDDGDDDDSNNDDGEVDDNDTENECLNIGTKRYYLKRKAEQNTVGDLHTLKSSVFPTSPKKTTASPTKTTSRAIATRTASIEQTPLSIVDVDGKIVISHPKKVYNRYSKEYRSAVRKQFIDCPE